VEEAVPFAFAEAAAILPGIHKKQVTQQVTKP
jgi:hypothetical protein